MRNLVNNKPDGANGCSSGGGSKSIELQGGTFDKVTSGTATSGQALCGRPGVAPPLIIPWSYLRRQVPEWRQCRDETRRPLQSRCRTQYH
jgi:hypothetical protein